MEQREFDVVVIGSGPGGEGAAIRLAKEGKRVGVIEAHTQVGGVCTHSGTIPSKALIYMVEQLVEARQNRFFQAIQTTRRVDYSVMLEGMAEVVRMQVREREGYYARNNIEIISGWANFIDSQHVEVLQAGDEPLQVKARAFVIATGSIPYRPKHVDFSHPRVMDSDTVLTMTELPRTITILGAGVVGCEYASAFRHLGIKVNLINMAPRLLPFLDEEISEALSYHMREQGTIIRNNEVFDRIEYHAEHIVTHLKSGKSILSDLFFWAAGRSGNSYGLGLNRIGVEVNDRGHIQVNENYQTAVPHVYAVGDVIGYPAMSSTSYDQGLMAGTHIVYGCQKYKANQFIPTGIYTIPEIGTVGRSEKTLTEDKIPYEVGHAFFRNIARSQITGHTTGMLKILFHRDSLEVLGIHCFGYQAAELVHVGQMVMSDAGLANSLLHFVNTTMNYPTLAEAYRVAALNGLNRIDAI